MKLKVVCQLCGRTQEIDTEKPIGQQPRWDSYFLDEFNIEGILSVWRDYEIWICDECHKKFLVYTGTVTDWTGEPYPEYEGDWDKLKEVLRESLKLHGKDTENSEVNSPENAVNENMLYTYTYMATKTEHLSPEEYYCPDVNDKEEAVK